jgi:predicted nucleic acid-binding protein
MPVLVVDASALGSLVFGEPSAEKVAHLLSEGRIIAPSLLWFEVASICLKKIRGHPSKKALIIEAFNNARRLDIEIVEVDHLEAIKLALDKGLTTYDASYLWLAREVRAELITLDDTMRKAFSSR